jgi:type IV pilus assembly protein PilB
MKLGRSRTPVSADKKPAASVGATPAAVSDLTVGTGGPRLGEMLVAADLATSDQIVEALSKMQGSTGKRLGQVLVEQGSLRAQDLARTLANQRGLQLIDLHQITPQPEAIPLLPESLARSLVAVPIEVSDAGVKVVVADPVEQTLEAIRKAIDRPVSFVVAAQPDVQRAIDASYRALTGLNVQMRTFEIQDAVRQNISRVEGGLAADDAPVVQVVQRVITQGVRDRASDIHIEPQETNVRIRFRIDGALHEVLELPRSIGPGLVSRIKIMGGMNIVERRRPQDGQIAMDIEGRPVDIRVNTTATIWGEKVVMRLLDKSRPLFNLKNLGMPEDTEEKYEALLRRPHGMVICAGPTGSGKTTTLYSSLAALNTPDKNLTTIEDPVEYTFPTINQIQINEAAGITFAGGLRSILRQDPDIILVGEIRDAETARIAVQSALTGHFVLSSVHATDSVSALHRLIDMGIESFLVAASISAIVAQRLVRRICTYCKVPYEPTAEELSFYAAAGGRFPDNGFFHGTGCNFCARTGYLDRIGVYEVLTISETIRQMILEHRSHDDIRKAAADEGLRTLQHESARLVENGTSTIAELMRSIFIGGH